jgi:hypothetical protein
MIQAIVDAFSAFFAPSVPTTPLEKLLAKEQARNEQLLQDVLEYLQDGQHIEHRQAVEDRNNVARFFKVRGKLYYQAWLWDDNFQQGILDGNSHSQVWLAFKCAVHNIAQGGKL